MKGVSWMTPAERVLERVERGPGCWLWPGAKNNHGYGQISYRGRRMYVHRVMYEHFHGAIPDGLTLDHLCRTPACCNPEHLEAVTHAENLRRGDWTRMARLSRERSAARTHCPRGHELVPYEEGKPRRCRECNRSRMESTRRANGVPVRGPRGPYKIKEAS